MRAFGRWAVLGIVLAACGAAAGSLRPMEPRKIISLDGTWQVEQGGMDKAPGAYAHSVAVPGLIDMAQPAFTEVGKRSGQRQAFWYRRTFKVDGPVPEIAILKLHKARYTARVYLNGQLVGDHLPCFTPAYLDVRPHLKGGGAENELVVRVGADRETVPAGQPSGWDFEKYLYIPGIYDSVELILTGAPYLVNVQAAPDLEKKTVRVVAEVRAGSQGASAALAVEVVEAAGGKPVASMKVPAKAVAANATETIELTLPMEGFRAWSPEDPFLYELRLSTGADAAKVRFGMRTFTFDPASKRAILNGKTYYMRGTNFTVYRFFEDAARGDKPWRAEWVRRLHRAAKSMHWNCVRYCIGFPPEMWYDIADEEGILVQDEFPIWLLGGAPEKPVTEKVIPEYTAWMRERWNHPCVAIWDGQNESVTDQTGPAINAVRGMDLSKRPWENGWAEPQSASDVVESHPYLFIRTWNSKGEKPFRMSELAKHSGMPDLQQRQKARDAAIIINEYCWLWLTREGNPTSLTDLVYESLLGKQSTAEQRRKVRARYVAALTEFWRCHRNAAAVMHFCTLGYSRRGDIPRPEGGATSDDFIDLEKLTFEPMFKEFVGEAFSPVGLMLDLWDEQLPAGDRRQIKVHVINDLHADWSGPVKLYATRGGQTVELATQPAAVPALGKTVLTFDVKLPADVGEWTIVAELMREGERVRSLRDVKVVAQ